MILIRPSIFILLLGLVFFMHGHAAHNPPDFQDWKPTFQTNLLSGNPNHAADTFFNSAHKDLLLRRFGGAPGRGFVLREEGACKILIWIEDLKRTLRDPDADFNGEWLRIREEFLITNLSLIIRLHAAATDKSITELNGWRASWPPHYFLTITDRFIEKGSDKPVTLSPLKDPGADFLRLN